MKIVDMLSSAAPHTSLAFDVICPSLPGYGFSDKPTNSGYHPREIARLFAALMKKLGSVLLEIHRKGRFADVR